MRRKVKIEDLSLGMYVAELDRPWLETPFLFQGFWIQDAELIRQLRQYCRYVLVDDQPERAPAAGRPQAVGSVRGGEAPPPHRDPDLAQLAAQVQVARQARASARRFFADLTRDIRLGESISAGRARETVHALIENIAESAAAALWLTNLKDKDEYTSIHSLNVCVFSLVFAHYLGLPDDQVETIGLGALLHDIGKLKTPAEILNKPGPLTAEEFRIVQRHPADGHDIAAASGAVPRQALEIVLHHHERLDGGGYPKGLSGGRIGLHVQITSIADVYDAITTERSYHQAIPPHEGLKVLHKGTAGGFARELVEEFIRCIGIYPVGSLVRLSNGSLGMVLSTDPRRRLRPVVMILRDPEGRPLFPRPLVNLAALADQEGGRLWAITGVADPAQHGIDPAEIVLAEQLMVS